MRIAKGEKINNIPLIKIRDYCIKIRNVGIYKEQLGIHFNLGVKTTNNLITELLKRNFIEKTPEGAKTFFGLHDDESDYRLTDLGYTFCNAKASTPINKEKADKIIKEILQRVEEINTNGNYLLKVKKLLIFGSYLNPQSKDYGDIDFAFELERKIDNYDEYEKTRKKYICELMKNNKKFPTFDSELNYPRKAVLLKLKNKCQYISLHEIEAEKEILKTAKTKQIYPS